MNGHFHPSTEYFPSIIRIYFITSIVQKTIIVCIYQYHWSLRYDSTVPISRVVFIQMNWKNVEQII